MGLPIVKIPETPALTLLASPAPRPARAYLVGPAADAWLVGGASLICAFLALCFFPASAPSANQIIFIYALSSVTSLPHFLSSYHMFYGDRRRELFRTRPFFTAGLVVPALLLAALSAGIYRQDTKILSALTVVMFCSLGWHYVRQAYRAVLAVSTVRSYSFKPGTRGLLQANLLSVWILSWRLAPGASAAQVFEGIPYTSPALPAGALYLACAVWALSGTGLLLALSRTYVRTGRVPPVSALLAFTSVYAWFLPAFAHPTFALLIPLFHALQYAALNYGYRHARAEAIVGPRDERRARQLYLRHFAGELALPFVTGALFLWLIPRCLDAHHAFGDPSFLPTAAFTAFTLFVNVHHFFLETALWRDRAAN